MFTVVGIPVLGAVCTSLGGLDVIVVLKCDLWMRDLWWKEMTVGRMMQ